VWWHSSMNRHHTLTYLSTVHQCHTHASPPYYPWLIVVVWWRSSMNQHHAHSSTMAQHSIHPYWPVPCTFINHDLALHTSICTFLNTYNGTTWTGSLVSPHKSLLPWAQSAANGYIVEFCPSDGTGISSIFTEQCESSYFLFLRCIGHLLIIDHLSLQIKILSLSLVVVIESVNGHFIHKLSMMHDCLADCDFQHDLLSSQVQLVQSLRLIQMRDPMVHLGHTRWQKWLIKWTMANVMARLRLGSTTQYDWESVTQELGHLPQINWL